MGLDQRSVFFEEWLRSLREQYKHVVRIGDSVTLPTLTAVMQNVGFGDEELAQLRVEATMRVEDVSADFRPDLDILETSPGAIAQATESARPPSPAPEVGPGDDEEQHELQEAEETAQELLQVGPVSEAVNDVIEEPDPQSFEDSLSQADTALEADLEMAEDRRDEPDERDADNPQQMSLF